MDIAHAVLGSVIQSGRFDELVKAASSWNEEMVVVACDLTGPKGIGAAVAQKLDPEDFVKRTDADQIWVFVYPLRCWHEFRESLRTGRDQFNGTGHAYVVVTDARVVIGRLSKPCKSHADGRRARVTMTQNKLTVRNYRRSK